MREDSRASVIISVYDGDQPSWLKECFDSIFNQTYRDIEIIVTCDGIQRNDLLTTLIQIQKISPFPFKIVTLDKNMGSGYAKNRALEKSSGNFLIIMDADDIMFPHRIEKQVSLLESQKDLDIIGSWVEEFDAQGEKICINKLPEEHHQLRLFFGKRNPIAHPSMAFKRRVLTTAGNYPEHTPVDEDTLFLLQGFLSNCRFANIQEPLIKMRTPHNFYKRRSGLKKTLFYLKSRLKVIHHLNLPLKYNFFALAKSLIRMIPSSRVKKYFYLHFR